MRPFTVRALLAVALGLCLAAATIDSKQAPQGPPATGAPLRWYKGNTHTHTLNSDGDSTPDDVVRWYREHGYQFLVLTDHNFLTSVDGLNALHGADERFLVVKGEEVTSTRRGQARARQQSRRRTPGGRADGRIDRSTSCSAASMPFAACPAFRTSTIPTSSGRSRRRSSSRSRTTSCSRSSTATPRSTTSGGGNVPGLEEVWDRLLSNGTLLYGIAVDDAHNFKQPGNPMVAGPGRGWVMVRAARLEPRALLESLERGDFYASTGVVLEDIVAGAADMTVKIKPEGTSKYRIQFIGAGGRILSEVGGAVGTLRVQRGRRVRARQGDREQRAHGVGPACPGAALRRADTCCCAASAFRRQIPSTRDAARPADPASTHSGRGRSWPPRPRRPVTRTPPRA